MDITGSLDPRLDSRILRSVCTFAANRGRAARGSLVHWALQSYQAHPERIILRVVQRVADAVTEHCASGHSRSPRNRARKRAGNATRKHFIEIAPVHHHFHDAIPLSCNWLAALRLARHLGHRGTRG
jgi:hypothetical protein